MSNENDPRQNREDSPVESSAVLADDVVWPGEEDIERLWEAQGGTDFDGMLWLTPRMKRIADRIAKRWESEKSANDQAQRPGSPGAGQT